MENPKSETEQQVERLKAFRRENKQHALIRYSNFDQGLVCMGTRWLWEDHDILNNWRVNNFNTDYYQAFQILQRQSILAKSKKGAIWLECYFKDLPTLFDNYEKFIDLFSDRVEHKLEVILNEVTYQQVLYLLPENLKACAKYLIKETDADFDLQMEKDFNPLFGSKSWA